MRFPALKKYGLARLFFIAWVTTQTTVFVIEHYADAITIETLVRAGFYLGIIPIMAYHWEMWMPFEVSE